LDEVAAAFKLMTRPPPFVVDTQFVKLDEVMLMGELSKAADDLSPNPPAEEPSLIAWPAEQSWNDDVVMEK